MLHRHSKRNRRPAHRGDGATTSPDDRTARMASPGGRRSTVRRLAASLAILLALAVAAYAGTAAAEVIQLGNIRIVVGGNFKPKRLPEKKMAPISLRVKGSITTLDGSPPPVLQRMVLDFDRNGTLYTKGLPRCDPRKLENTLTRQALKKCRGALVGRGHTEAIIDFPDQEPFTAEGPLLIFNGKPRGGKPVVVFHVFAHVPLPTTFVVPAVISNAPGSAFGKRVTIDIPPISGGNGALSAFDSRIKRTWKHKGRKRSYLIARCNGGRFVARGDFRFLDGSRLNGSVVRPCKTRKTKRKR